MNGEASKQEAELSVVVCAERIASLGPLISKLNAQSDPGRIELIVVCPSIDELGPIPEAGHSLAGIATVGHRDKSGGFVDLPAARAAGVRRASAPLVVLGETHCFPAPGWADSLIETHAAGRAAAVGPVILNANPRTAISWANLITDYGPWIPPTATGPRTTLPGHNSCYRREELLGYDGRLAEMLTYEAALHDDLRRSGRELVLSEGARVRHLNVSTAGDWLRERFHAGRAFAAARSGHWPRWRRAVYFLGAPLIPLVRLGRLAPVARRTRGRPTLARLLPVLAAGLVVHAAGEAAGFALGAGGAWRVVTRIELYRERSVRPSEQPVKA
jgi:hypothetical protein